MENRRFFGDLRIFFERTLGNGVDRVGPAEFGQKRADLMRVERGGRIRRRGIVDRPDDERARGGDQPGLELGDRGLTDELASQAGGKLREEAEVLVVLR